MEKNRIFSVHEKKEPISLLREKYQKLVSIKNYLCLLILGKPGDAFQSWLLGYYLFLMLLTSVVLVDCFASFLRMEK